MYLLFFIRNKIVEIIYFILFLVFQQKNKNEIKNQDFKEQYLDFIFIQKQPNPQLVLIQ